MTKRFSNKVVLITGAASGIGRATAMAFAREGATLVLADIDKIGCEETVQIILSEGGNATFRHADVSKNTDVSGLMQHIVSMHGRLDCAFNNAGIEGTPVRTADVDEAEFDQIIAVNLKGVWLCMKYELRQMIEQKSGVIINISSVAGLVGAHSLPAYAASKHGVIGLTKSAALEYARKGIRVNAVCPAMIRTAMVERSIQAAPQLADIMESNNPSKRLGEPTEVAAAVLWLCSPDASFVNGAALPIDGGFVAQ